MILGLEARKAIFHGVLVCFSNMGPIKVGWVAETGGKDCLELGAVAKVNV